MCIRDSHHALRGGGRAKRVGMGAGVQQAGQIHAGAADLQRIRGQRGTLCFADIAVYTVGKRKDQRNTDDANGTGEGGEQGARLFGEQVVEAEGKGGEQGHGRVPHVPVHGGCANSIVLGLVGQDVYKRQHICCAMSGKQSFAKKEWLKQRFEDGLVFYRSAERGKCFIEYIPAENAWVPIDAAGWLYINCLWVSGSMKGHGYSSELLEECLRDAKAQGKNGVCILCAEGRKREFLADPKFLTHKGFKVSDISDCGINLMYLPLAESAQPPKFKACAKHPKVEENGFVLYYTDQCPYTCLLYTSRCV